MKQKIGEVVIALRHTQKASPCGYMNTRGQDTTPRHLHIRGVVADGYFCPSVPQWSLACITAVACLVSLVPELSLGFQSHQLAPWSWRDTKAGVLRLSWHGQNCPIGAEAGTVGCRQL